MISPNDILELRAFAAAERDLPLNIDYRCASLVTPVDNGRLPVHQWFKYKEAFSPKLLDFALALAPLSGRSLRLLDPFCGVGTSIVAAQEAYQARPMQAIGIECNPFSAFVARTKLQWPVLDPRHFLELGNRALEDSGDRALSESLPRLSSIMTGRCLSKSIARRIVSIRDAIRSRGNSTVQDALILGLAASVEPVSKVRRDGRALRIVTKSPTPLRKELTTRWAMMVDDIRRMKGAYPKAPPFEILEGDGRRPRACGIEAGSINLIVTSPPYPNNIDYSEVYKLELWLMGLAHSSEEFLSIRKRTFRSHPTCAAPTEAPEYGAFMKRMDGSRMLRRLLTPLLDRVNRIPGRWRSRVLSGYCMDTWTSLSGMYTCLRRGGRAVIVVGNSLHGGKHDPYVIPTDLIFATVGREIGFDVEAITIARPLKRRLVGNHFLRDSIVILRKPS
jgi:hypothetical protein